MSDGSQLDVDPRISAIVRALRDFGHLACNQGGWRSAGLADFIINEADAADRAEAELRERLAAQVSTIIYEAPMVIGRPARLFERAFAAILGAPPAT